MLPLLLKLRALPWRLIGVAALSAGAFLTGFKVNDWRRDSVELAVMLAAEKAGEKSRNAAVTAIEGIEVRNVTIRQRAETVIREVPVYRECRHDGRVFDDINQALAEPGSDPPRVPAAGPADGR
jgi:hypothetical protein